jgi:hypothetical protein
VINIVHDDEPDQHARQRSSVLSLSEGTRNTVSRSQVFSRESPVNTLQPDQTSSTSDPGQSTSSQNQLELPSNQNTQSRLNSNQPSLLTSDSQPFPSRPNQNLGMSFDPIIFTEPHNSGGSNTFNAIDTRLQEFQSPEKILSVFEPISAHIPVKIKEKIWNGEFIEWSVLLKSNRDLVNKGNNKITELRTILQRES